MFEQEQNERPYINPYMELMLGDFDKWCLTEEGALSFKGKWREKVFSKPEVAPLDLEIGTGNGFFFAHYASQNPDRSLVGLELKYKPLIQTIKRAIDSGATNMRMARAKAERIDEYFSQEEINRIFLHFPDPWPKRRHHKNRLISRAFLNSAYEILKPGGYLEFKTDSLEYFVWAQERLAKSPFTVTDVTNDLHQSEFADRRIRTHFEKLWIRKGRKTNYLMARKES